MANTYTPIGGGVKLDTYMKHHNYGFSNFLNSRNPRIMTSPHVKRCKIKGINSQLTCNNHEPMNKTTSEHIKLNLKLRSRMPRLSNMFSIKHNTQVAEPETTKNVSNPMLFDRPKVKYLRQTHLFNVKQKDRYSLSNVDAFG